MVHELVIIRGIPGAGKSTYAREAYPTHTNFEADTYFIQQDGTYSFDPRQLPAAHNWCYRQALRSLKRGQNVVVSNTFTQPWEVTRYIEMVETLPQLSIKVITLTSEYDNVHGVPPEKVAIMKNRFYSHDKFMDHVKQMFPLTEISDEVR